MLTLQQLVYNIYSNWNCVVLLSKNSAIFGLEYTILTFAFVGFWIAEARFFFAHPCERLANPNFKKFENSILKYTVFF